MDDVETEVETEVEAGGEAGVLFDFARKENHDLRPVGGVVLEVELWAEVIVVVNGLVDDERRS